MTTVTMRTTGGAATIKVRPVAQHPMVALTFLNIGPEVSLPVTADGSAAGHLTSATGLHVRIGIGNRLGLGHVSATPEPELGVTNGASSCGYLQGAGNEHPVGTEKPYTSDGSCARELLLQGVVEPDSDGDGFGDETQDLCPTNAAIQVACPVSVTPAAGAKKKCKKKKRKDSAEAAKRKCKRKKK
jgi:hypothetical protein